MANEIMYSVAPGYYLNPFTVNMILGANVESLQYSVNAGAPSISKYIAYDTLVPPNPFIAITQDGRGNVVYDGGFPKFYNTHAPSANITAFDNAVRLEATRPSTAGNTYCYFKLSDETVSIDLGHKLVYDVWGDSAIVNCAVDGMVDGLGGIPLRHGNIFDQNGLSSHPSTDLTARAGGKWYHREMDLSEWAGHAIDNWSVALENEAVGVHVAYVKEVYIKNASGVIVATLFKDTYDFPSGALSNTSSNLMMGMSTRKVDVRSQLTPAFKYLFNALRFCENKTKIAAGNNKILFIGDANAGASYNIKGVTGSDFFTSFSRIALIAGYTATFKTAYEWGSGAINPTLGELEEYVAVIFMSSVYQGPGGAYLVTPDAVDAFLTYRENGNGLIFITDHGPVIADIATASNSNSGGFFASANRIITGFGAWFSGDYTRTPVNVGFLRTTYGDHPLYATMLDSEAIPAGGSESRVNVASFASVAPGAVPPINIPLGKTTIQVAAVLFNGDVVTSRVVYWVVDFTVGIGVDGVVKTNGQIADIGVKNKVPVAASLIGTLTENAAGSLYLGATVIGSVSYTPAGGFVITFTGGNSVIKLNNGNELKLVLTSPLAMTIAVTIKRFQPILPANKPLSKVLKNLRTWNPQLSDIERIVKMVKDIATTYPGLNINYSTEYPANLKLIKDHFKNEGPTSN
jgi:hypothetical protein